MEVGSVITDLEFDILEYLAYWLTAEFAVVFAVFVWWDWRDWRRGP
jgi:hypothetical protein